MWEKRYIEETDSTNNQLKLLLEKSESELPQGFTLYTFFQTAGRGQQGNSWESKAGENLLFSTCYRPVNLKASSQFLLSMAVSVLLVRVLRKYVPTICIKWPNDIYCADRKLVGILIENKLTGDRVGQSVIGIGLNVNQTLFSKNIPNPTSLKLLTGKDTDKDKLLDEILSEFANISVLIDDFDALKEQYCSLLYRRYGMHLYRELTVGTSPVNIAQTASSDCFEAEISDIEQDGRLLLRKADGTFVHYHFKQIQYIIP